MNTLKADQIAYSVLCVFSYVAAGQEQQKNLNAQKVLDQHKSTPITTVNQPSKLVLILSYI